jgi:hypothetical protein
MYVVQSIKSGKHTSFIKQSQNEYNVAKVALDDNKKKLLGLIGDVYGHNYAHMVSMGSLWEGMPMNLLMLAKGKASNVKQSADTNAVTQIWTYSLFDERAGKHTPCFEVVLRNGLVESWTELN